jgi:hypothetical protein
MTVAWSPDDLERIGAAEELQIATSRADGGHDRDRPPVHRDEDAWCAVDGRRMATTR